MLNDISFPLADVEASVRKYVEAVPNFKAFKITDDCFALKGVPSNMCNVDYIHVYRKGTPPYFACTFGSRCERVMVKITKKTRTSSRCPHEHFVNLIIGSNTSTQSEAADVLNEGPSTSTDLDDENIWLQNSSLYRYRNQRISLKDEDMKPIEPKWDHFN